MVKKYKETFISRFAKKNNKNSRLLSDTYRVPNRRNAERSRARSENTNKRMAVISTKIFQLGKRGN
jgi:hypothetical protein